MQLSKDTWAEIEGGEGKLMSSLTSLAYSVDENKENWKGNFSDRKLIQFGKKKVQFTSKKMHSFVQKETYLDDERVNELEVLIMELWDEIGNLYS